MNAFNNILSQYSEMKLGFEKEYSRHKTASETALQNMDLVDRAMNGIKKDMCQTCTGTGFEITTLAIHNISLRDECSKCRGTGMNILEMK